MDKILIASDIHGSARHCQKLINAFYDENAETLLLLGDILDGDREVAAMLNELDLGAGLNQAQRQGQEQGQNQNNLILCVRGNCDYPSDQALLAFPMPAEYCLLFAGNKRIFAAHGNRAIPNLKSGDIYLHGHTHVPTWDFSKDYAELNPGSVSEPRRGSKHGYMTLEAGKENKNSVIFLWKDLDGNIFHELKIK